MHTKDGLANAEEVIMPENLPRPMARRRVVKDGPVLMDRRPGKVRVNDVLQHVWPVCYTTRQEWHRYV